MQARTTAHNVGKPRKRSALPPAETWASDLQLARRYSVSRSTIWRWNAEGLIPHPEKIGPNITRWRLADVIEKLEREAAT